jgi:hypothetical protein
MLKRDKEYFGLTAKIIIPSIKDLTKKHSVTEEKDRVNNQSQQSSSNPIVDLCPPFSYPTEEKILCGV